jgi:NhaP-type Na+/H+ or K+/H+ antiporter
MLQFVFYGLVGGCLNAIGTTAFMRLALGQETDWSFALLMSIGALLSTSDASFTSRILKKAGVPERLVGLVEGEAINDAPMFTVLLLAKELYSRLNMNHDDLLVPVSAMEVVAIATRLILCGLGLGVLMAVIIMGLLKFTSSQFEERNPILQVLITLVGCYSTFLLAEVVFDMSGPLSIVTVGWILAWKMWPIVVSEEAMTSFWSTIDFAAESLLYLLVGFYVGVEAYSVDLNYGLRVACMMWGVSMGCRFVSIFLCWPILNRLGPSLNWREVVMWGWCGIKGRVCLALITSFSIHLLDESSQTGGINMKSHVIFVVGVVFLMSSVVNGGLAGFVAMLLRLDKAGEMEDKLRTVFFKYSLFNSLKQDRSLADHCHHLAHYSLSGDNGGRVSKVEIFAHQPKPTSAGIDWATVEREELVVAIRSTFLTILKSLYWNENGEQKVSIYAIQGLLSAVDRAMEDIEEKPINDFYHLMLLMPARENKSNHYRIINMLLTMADCHVAARGIFENELMKPIIESDAADVDMLVSLRTAWEEVQGESEKSENYARREMSVRFSQEEIETYSTLRNLHLGKIEEILHSFAKRKLLSEKDVVEAHDALHEDMIDIKLEMRSIGGDRGAYDSDEQIGDPDDETRPLNR